MRFGGSAVGAGVLSTACSAVVPSVADVDAIWIEVLSAACSAVVLSVADGDANLDPSRCRRFCPLRDLAAVFAASCLDRGRRRRFRRLRVACRCIVVAVFVVCVSFAV